MKKLSFDLSSLKVDTFTTTDTTDGATVRGQSGDTSPQFPYDDTTGPTRDPVTCGAVCNFTQWVECSQDDSSHGCYTDNEYICGGGMT